MRKESMKPQKIRLIISFAGMVVGLGMLLHHRWKYGIFFHRRVVRDHGVYGILFMTAATVGFVISAK
jgi:hypothetical protein